MVRGGPRVIRCSVSAPSTILSSISAGSLVSVLLGAFSTELYFHRSTFNNQTKSIDKLPSQHEEDILAV